MFTVDWISQLSVFHRLLHSRVQFVTGSTGVGKSTQVPKLALYGTLAFQYRTDARIACTAPRIIPTTENATRISKEMGIPIEKESDYTVQFSHSEKRYTPPYVHSRSFLRIMTDGSLLESIASTPFMLEKYEVKPRRFRFTGRSVWDIIIVDESHEHNTNMDVILSLMRYIMTVNPDVVLIVMSATMDNDERRFRQFFRNIEDRHMVDRRVHIATGTRFLIEEAYEKKEALSFEEAEALALKRVLSLASQTSGDILLFSVGEYEIRKAVTLLNRFLPANAIALPFYGRLPAWFRTLVTNTKRCEYVERTELLAWIDENSKRETPQSRNTRTYSKRVVIATNVAEASITINTLRVVVDTGYARVSTYDPYVGQSTLTVAKISESSRLQRRGRVGRVAPGKVYYMYPPNARKMVEGLMSYGIVNGNSYESLLPVFYPPSIRGEWDDDITVLLEEVFPGRRKEWRIDTLPDITDQHGEFYVIHPDEDRISRDKWTGLIDGKSAAYETWKIHYIHHIYSSNEFLHRILHNGDRLDKVRRDVIAMRLVSLGVCDLVAMYAARSLGVITPVLEHLIREKVLGERTIRSDIVSNPLRLASFDPDDRTVVISKLPPENLVWYCRMLLDTSLTPLPQLTIPLCLNKKEAVNFCLYYSQPLNLAIARQGKWINAFSTRPLPLLGSPSSTACSYHDKIVLPLSFTAVRLLSGT